MPVHKIHGTDRQECQLGVFWTGMNDADDEGRGHNVFRGMVTCDLGLDAVPVPPFTDREMQTIAHAAKMQALGCLHTRAALAAAEKRAQQGDDRPLTKAQREELRKQLKGPQPTFGKFRARTQNALVARGLSRFLDDESKPTLSHGVPGVPGSGGYPDTCEITEAGRRKIGATR